MANTTLQNHDKNTCSFDEVFFYRNGTILCEYTLTLHDHAYWAWLSVDFFPFNMKRISLCQQLIPT